MYVFWVRLLFYIYGKLGQKILLWKLFMRGVQNKKLMCIKIEDCIKKFYISLYQKEPIENYII